MAAPDLAAVQDAQPFEIVDADGGAKVASNGRVSLTVLPDVQADGGVRLFKRRAIKGINVRPAGEVALPLLNQLAGELVADLGMPSFAVADRLRAIADQVVPTPPQRVEWVVAEVDGRLRVYFDGDRVIVTGLDLNP